MVLVKKKSAPQTEPSSSALTRLRGDPSAETPRVKLLMNSRAKEAEKTRPDQEKVSSSPARVSVRALSRVTMAQMSNASQASLKVAPCQAVRSQRQS